MKIKFNLRNVAFFIFIVFFLVAFSGSHPTTGSGGYTGAPGDTVCSGCHSSNNTSLEGDVEINGLPSTIMSGQTYSITVTINNPSLNANRGGFQLVALNSTNSNAGSMSNTGSNSNIKVAGGKNYFGHHNGAKLFSGDPSITYTMDWTAPTGPNNDNITMYAGAILASGDSGNQNDRFVVTTTSGTLMASNPPLVLNITNTQDVSCFGFSDGSATVEATGGDGNYSYLWTSGETTATATNLSAGINTVTVTDGTGESEQISTNIGSPDLIVVTPTVQSNVSCSGDSDGAATVDASGGVPGFTYQWTGGLTGTVQTNLSAGEYTITATDSNGCTNTASFTITEPDPITIDETITDVSCFGGSDGAIVVQPMGGTPNYSYIWSNGGSSPSINGLTAGTYSVTVTDDNGCAGVESYDVSEPDQITITGTVTDVSCFGGSDGVIDVIAMGGTPGYNYSWSNGGSSPTQNGLIAGTYTVTVTDDNECTASETFVVSEPDLLEGTVDFTIPVSCNGGSDGSVEISITGGTPPYTIDYPGGVNSFPAGIYNANIIDANMCTNVVDFEITEPNPIDIVMTSTGETSLGADDGTATASPSGGTPDYSYEWSNGGTSQTITDLAPGEYTVTVTDFNECTASASVTVASGDCNVMASVNTTNVSCNGESDGSIELTLTGAADPVTYQWSDGQSTATATGLPAGTYGVTATDAENCTVEVNGIMVTEPEVFEMTATILSLPECNQTDGMVTLSLTGGTEPYNWFAQTSDTTIMVGAGTFTYLAMDDNGCVASTTVEVTEIDTTGPDLMLVSSLTIYIDENGMTDPLNVSDFDNGTTDNCGTVSSIAFAESYEFGCDDTGDNEVSIIAEDDSGNTSEGTSVVMVLDTLSPIVACPADITITSCGPITFSDITATDNCGNVTIVQLEGLESGDVFPEGVTTQTYSVTDDSGNETICSFDITVEASTLEAMAVVTNVSCPGGNDGSIEIIVTGGTPPYTFTPSDLGNLPAGTYEITITDAAGCVAIVSAEINEPVPVTVTNVITNDTTGTISIDVSGGTGDLTFVWTDTTTTVVSTEEDPTGLDPGTYFVEITDENDCVFNFGGYIIEDIISATEDLFKDSDIKVYPNPSQGMVWLDMVESDYKIDRVDVISISGKSVKTLDNPATYNSKMDLDLGQIENGFYFLRLQINDQMIFKKILINK